MLCRWPCWSAAAVRGPDKKCKIVETRPADKTVMVIGDKAYVTRDEAAKQMAVVCK